MSGDSQSFFRFSLKERRAIIALILLILLAKCIPWIVNRLVPPEFPSVGLYTLQSLDSLANAKVSQRDDVKYHARALSENLPKELRPFFFDPNHLDDHGWLQLGVPPRVVRTIRNYLEKGGRFRQAADLFRIHGMDSLLARKLMPFASLPDASEKKPLSNKPHGGKQIDINRADSLSLLSLPGIGPVLAGRIVSYRKKLGGFVSVGQLTEVYGLKDSVLSHFRERLIADTTIIKKISVNKADVRELGSHPYIRFPMARAITDYRKSNGDFRTADQLLKIMSITKEQLDKVRPYLSIP